MKVRFDRTKSSRPPMAIAMRYQSFLRALFDVWHDKVLALVTAGWERNTVAFSGRLDAPLSTFTANKLQGLDLIIEETFKPHQLAGEIDVLASRISKHGLLEFKRTVGISLTHDPGVGAAMRSFRDVNVDKIKSLALKERERLRDILADGEAGAWRVEELSKKMVEEFGVTKSKADLLARDQVMKLNGQVTQLRQQAAGITEYIWSTAGDERVREYHSDLDGTKQSWASPPVISEDGRTGHPGDDYQCRCTAIPVLPELDEQVTDE